MSSLVIFLFGIIIVVSTIVDILWTTLWVDRGAGPITNALSNIIWSLFSKVKKVNKNSLKLSGPVILAATLFEWVVLLWAGWAIVFYSHLTTESILNTVNKAPVVWQNYIYYSGYTLFTLGSGDYAPATPFW